MKNIFNYFLFSALILTICSIIACKNDNADTKVDSEINNNMVQTGNTEIDFLSKEISKNGLDPELRFRRAEALSANNMFNEAIEDLRVAITVDSLKPKYYHLLSDVFMDSNNSSKSLQTMLVAHNLFRERIPTKLKLAETHYIIEQYEKSVGVLNDIFRLDQQNAEAYFMLGLNFRELGDTTRAMNALQTATEFDSKLVDAWLVLAEILESRGSKKAKDYLETATRVAPNNLNALHSYAYYLQNNNEIEAALEVYKNMNTIDKYYGDAYLNAGILRIEQDELALAKEQFEILASQQKLNPVAQYYLGYINMLEGDVETAKVHAQNAINLNGDYEKAKELLQTLNQ